MTSTDYLLARICANLEQIEVKQVLEDAETYINNIYKQSSPVIDLQVEELYKLYPSKCLVSGRSLGKSLKDKDRIKSRITTIGYDKLKFAIEKYKETCLQNQVYMKNLQTFLNNIPDYTAEEREKEPTPIWQ